MAWFPGKSSDKRNSLSKTSDNPLALDVETLIAWRQHRERYFVKMREARTVTTMQAWEEISAREIETSLFRPFLTLYPCAICCVIPLEQFELDMQFTLEKLSTPDTYVEEIRFI